MSQLRQDSRIPFARHNGVQNCQPASPRDVAEHRMDLQIHLGEGFLHMLHVHSRHLHQAVAVTE